MSDMPGHPGDSENEPEQTQGAHPEQQALAALQALFATGSALCQDYLDLLAVEGRLAGRSLVLMLALGIALGLLLVAAWIFFTLAASALLIEIGWLNPWQALLAVAIAHVGLALLAWVAVRRLSDNLVFSGLRSALEPRATERSEP
ncbi:MAG: hypothetical protein JJU31_11400 [Wenzhouxiangella sp.]|nr:hypothetical protein [Wenzhouxiangella sp.]MCH8477671.1 hypothetical protein [Wenzhouxiangella sp.]TVR94498.1 MAG: hypothetical protein EA418_10130 [Wenzhouxiangellaceae bacterium]